MRSGSFLKTTRVHPFYASFNCRCIIDHNCRCVRDIVESVNKFVHANTATLEKTEWFSQQTTISIRTTHSTNKRVPLVFFKAEQTPARPIHFSESKCKPFNGLSNDSANNPEKKASISAVISDWPQRLSVKLKTHTG